MVKPCMVGGCPEDAVPGRGKCRTHGPSQPTAGSRGYDYGHQQLRKVAINTMPHVCGLCHLPILPHQAIHLDHIIPLSMGGTRTRENTQLAHEGCNISKGGSNRLNRK